MHAHLEGAAVALGISDELTNVAAASARSTELVAFARGWLRERMRPGDETMDVVAFGSLARLEFTPASDFDYLVVAHAVDHRPHGRRVLLDAADALRAEFAVRQGMPPQAEVRAPGATKLFGVVVSAMDVSEYIGLQDDTNHHHTRRLLLLEESVSLFQPERHALLVRGVIDRYLDGYAEIGKPGVPRFLLNDVVRYWRTLTVDYQAKVWGGSAGGWGLRYLKLIVSRKLTYAGTLASLLTCSDEQPASVDHLLEQFTMPPLARLAQLHRHFAGDGPALEALGRALVIADTFIARSADEQWRARVKRVQDLSQASSVPEFEEMRIQARSLQNDLETVFFRSHALRAKGQKYLAF